LLRELLAQHSHRLLFSTFLNSLKVLGNLVIRTWKEIKEERKKDSELNAKTEEKVKGVKERTRKRK
jgi:hypothetical protein